jgi:glycosyltransferase involved in cell wall biosynthesis
VTVLCAERDPARPHGEIVWRLQGLLPVAEIINNRSAATFADIYRSPLLTRRTAQVLDAVQPHVIHVHSLLNLSFDLPAVARARGVPIVATLHDYSLVCPSGGQRVHRAEAHLCRTIETERCARCFPDSTFFVEAAFARAAALTGRPKLLTQAGRALAERAPQLMAYAATAVSRSGVLPVTAADIEARLAASRAAFDDIELFVAPSPSIAAEFRALGIDPSKIRVSDYGFAPLAPRPPAARGGPLRIGFVGTLVWHKGVHVLIDAVAGLPRDAYELKVYGDTRTFPDYAARLQAQGAGLPVTFMGAFDRADIADVYSGIDVLVVPSLWLENSPLVIHEAFLARVPVVAARIGGIVDLVADGRNGLLYDHDSPAMLRGALKRLIESPDLLATLQRTQPSVKRIDEDAREWDAVYREVLGRRVATGVSRRATDSVSGFDPTADGHRADHEA